MKKKALLLDTNFSAKPIYDYLIDTGYEVYVLGGKPDDALAKLSPNYIHLDYSNIKELKSIIRKMKIDFLIPGGNDLSYKICSEINTEFNFPNIDSTEVEQIINNKEKYRKFCQSINLHVPQIVNYENITNNIPVIVKPVDAYSGHGMTVLFESDNNKINDAVNYAKKFSKSQKYIIEEFVQGQLYSHSAFIVDGEIIIDFIVEEHCIVNPYVVDTSRVIFNFNENILNQIRKDISSFANKLNLSDGLIHTQFICNGRNFWLIEANRRCPGDLYSKLIEYSTGFPYAKYYANPFNNIKYDMNNFALDKKFILRHTITLNNQKYINSISFKYPVNILEYVSLSTAGDKIRISPLSRIGLLFLKLKSESELKKMLIKTINRELYIIN